MHEHPAFFSYRSTDEFEIKVSKESTGPFTTVVSDKLENGLGKPCTDIELETFTLENPFEARYVEFHIKSYFDYSGGLQYMALRGKKMD